MSYLAIPMMLAACSMSGHEAPQRRWIIGFGWVDTVRDGAVAADSLTMAGLVAGGGGFQAGLVQQHSTRIDPRLAGDALVEVEASPGRLAVRSRNVLPNP